MNRRNLYLLAFKYLAYLIRSLAFKCQTEHPSYYLGSLFIHDPMVLIIRILDISVWR